MYAEIKIKIIFTLPSGSGRRNRATGDSFNKIILIYPFRDYPHNLVDIHFYVQNGLEPFRTICNIH